MFMMSAITWDPAAIAAWLVAGLAVAWLTAKLTEEPSYGIIGDLIGGGVGALLGGLAYGFFMTDAGFLGGILVAILVAGMVVLGTRAFVATRSE